MRNMYQNWNQNTHKGNCITGCYCELIEEIHGVVVMIVCVYQHIFGLLSIFSWLNDIFHNIITVLSATIIQLKSFKTLG
jgi:hypothetical protein